MSGLVLVSIVAFGCSLNTQGLDYGKEDGAGGATASSSGSTSSSSSGSGSGSSGGGALGVCESGFECVPTITAGTYARRAMTAMESCPAGWTPSDEVSDGTDPGCADCSCAKASGGACVSGNLHRWMDTACTMVETNLVVVSGQCVSVVPGAGGYAIDPPKVAPGACAPSPGDEKPIEKRSLCTFDPEGAAPCGDAGVCVPVSAGSFGEVCNLLPSASKCAAEWPTQEFLYGGFLDTRQCICTCGSPSGSACTDAGGTLYSGPTCNQSKLLTVKAGAGCVNAGGAPTGQSMKISGGTWSGGTCAPSSNKSGTVMFTDAMVLCCP